MSTKKDSFDSGALPFGGFPLPARKIGITISGLEEWKEGVVSGTTVQVDILQKGKTIHSEVFSGKASSQFTREIVISASSADLVAVHNRADLPGLRVSAEFIDDQKPFVIKDGQVFIQEMSICVNTETDDQEAERIKKIVHETVKESIKNAFKPGGLLYGQ